MVVIGLYGSKMTAYKITTIRFLKEYALTGVYSLEKGL